MDTALLEKVQEETAEIKTANDLTPDQPVKFKPKAWTRLGRTD